MREKKSQGVKVVKYIECSEYMTEPSDIAIFGDQYYICDFKGKDI